MSGGPCVTMHHKRDSGTPANANRACASNSRGGRKADEEVGGWGRGGRSAQDHMLYDITKQNWRLGLTCRRRGGEQGRSLAGMPQTAAQGCGPCGGRPAATVLWTACKCVRLAGGVGAVMALMHVLDHRVVWFDRIEGGVPGFSMASSWFEVTPPRRRVHGHGTPRQRTSRG